MQQLPAPTTAAPTFWQLVIGTIIGQIGCFIAYMLLAVCLVVFFGALLAPTIGNIFSRITPGLNVP